MARSLQSDDPVATGYEYGVASLGYVCYDDGDGGNFGSSCEWYPEYGAYASVNVSPSIEVTGIDPESATAGDPLSIHITGTGIQSNATVTTDACCIVIGNFQFSTVVSPGVQSTETISVTGQIQSTQPAGTVHFIVTNPNGDSDSGDFTVLPMPPPPPPPPSPPIDPCAVTSNPQVGYTSIVSTGMTGSSGTMAVSFSGAAYAAVTPTVTYGPYSTPGSIAANIAALITKSYYRYGLSAKAFGPNVIYSANTTLGTVSSSFSSGGSRSQSFGTDTSSGAESVAQNECEEVGADYSLSPNPLSLSTGDTNKQISISNPSGSTLTGIAYTPSLLNNHASSCQSYLSFKSPTSASTVVTASPANCSGVFSVQAAVNMTTAYGSVIVPPQQLIQVMYGEANVAVGYVGSAGAKVLMEALGNTIGNRYLDPLFSPNSSWQALITENQFGGYNPSTQSIVSGVEPELDAAAAVFAQSLPIASAQNAQCFFSPDTSGWSAIQQAQASGAQSVPNVTYDPGCYTSATKQFLIKTSAGAYASGRPFFIFVQSKAATDPAIVTIP